MRDRPHRLVAHSTGASCGCTGHMHHGQGPHAGLRRQAVRRHGDHSPTAAVTCKSRHVLEACRMRLSRHALHSHTRLQESAALFVLCAWESILPAADWRGRCGAMSHSASRAAAQGRRQAVGGINAVCMRNAVEKSASPPTRSAERDQARRPLRTGRPGPRRLVAPLPPAPRSLPALPQAPSAGIILDLAPAGACRRPRRQRAGGRRAALQTQPSRFRSQCPTTRSSGCSSL